MVFELTLGNLITIVALGIAGAWALVKVINTGHERRMADNFAALGDSLKRIAEAQDRNATATLELEREFRKHLTDVARDYVRRDDFMRHIGTIEVRIDNFALRMEQALIQLGVIK